MSSAHHNPASEPQESAARAIHALAAADDAERQLRILVHEVANLLDGSIRSLSLARRGLERHADPGHGPLSDALSHMDAANRALNHIAQIVRTIGRDRGSSIGVPTNPKALDALTLQPIDEAIRDAVTILEPLAQEHDIRITTRVDPRLTHTPSGPIQCVIVNAIRNAIESIRTGGTIAIDAEIRHEASASTPTIVIEIADDGPGLAPGTAERLFDFGFTTKPDGSGIGLALAHEIIGALGGSISLRPNDSQAADARPGARLVISYPAPALLRRSASPRS